MSKLLNGLDFRAGQPAITSFIPPSVDSIILDYQSPNAQAGFYPNEDPNSGGVGERRSPAPLPSPFRLIQSSALRHTLAWMSGQHPEQHGASCRHSHKHLRPAPGS